MVLQLAPDLLAALEDSHQPGYVVQAFYGDELTEESVPVTADGSLSFDSSGQIQARGNVFLASDGASLVPKSKTDSLAPYGQELTIARTVSVSGQVIGSIPLGIFRITEVPDSKEYFRRYPSQSAVVGWVAALTVEDRFEQLIADDFIQTTGPVAGNTVWAEIRRLSPFPIVASLPDKAIPAGVTYSSRYDAIRVLMEVLGGKPALTRQGALTARPANPWMTATEPQFTINGTISLDDSMSNKLFNQVQLKSSVGGNELVAVAKLSDESNPLAVTRPIGGRTYRDTLPLATQAALNAAAQTVLERVSTRQSKTVKVRCLPRPDLELGDFGIVNDPVSGRSVTGEVAGMSFSMDPTADMQLELVAAETR